MILLEWTNLATLRSGVAIITSVTSRCDLYQLSSTSGCDSSAVAINIRNVYLYATFILSSTISSAFTVPNDSVAELFAFFVNQVASLNWCSDENYSLFT